MSERTNKEITAEIVRVINSQGNHVGLLKTAAALELAAIEGMDLVEVAPKAEPPVCRIMDYSKHLAKAADREALVLEQSEKGKVPGYWDGHRDGYWWASDSIYEGIAKHFSMTTGEPVKPLHEYAEVVLCKYEWATGEESVYRVSYKADVADGPLKPHMSTRVGGKWVFYEPIVRPDGPAPVVPS